MAAFRGDPVRSRFFATFLFLLVLAIASLVLSASGGGSMATCTVSTNISPTSAVADHLASPPGNQVKFMATGNVSGSMCPLTPDVAGTWSTSDLSDTTINTSMAQEQNVALVTCVNAAAAPITIGNSGTVRGKRYPSAMLTCK